MEKRLKTAMKSGCNKVKEWLEICGVGLEATSELVSALEKAKSAGSKRQAPTSPTGAMRVSQSEAQPQTSRGSHAETELVGSGSQPVLIPPSECEIFLSTFLGFRTSGADPGGPPPPFWGTPKLHKEGKKRCAHACENAPF